MVDFYWSLQPRRSYINCFAQELTGVKQHVSRSRRSDLVVGSWNIRTLVECLGDVRVCRKRQVLGERLEVVDRKLD